MKSRRILSRQVRTGIQRNPLVGGHSVGATHAAPASQFSAENAIFEALAFVPLGFAQPFSISYNCRIRENCLMSVFLSKQTATI